MKNLGKSCSSKKRIWKVWFRGVFLAVVLMTASLTFISEPQEVKAATEGFKIMNGKGYYIKKDGSKYKGWKNIGGKKYLFDFKTGEQVIGWQKDQWGNYLRYFSRQYGPKGYMATGFWKDGKGNVRFFKPDNGLMTKGWAYDKGNHRFFDRKNGIMYRGVRKVDKYYYYFMGHSKPEQSGYRCKKGFTTLGEKKYYFSPQDGRAAVGWLTKDGKSYYFDSKGEMYKGVRKVGKYYYYFMGNSGERCQSGFKTLGSKRYYFNPKDGHAHVGWLNLDGKKYYFDKRGVMYVNITFNMSGKKYKADADGIVTEANASGSGGKYQYTVHSENGGYVKAYDPKNGRYYYLAREFATHPGVANGEKTDRDLLAAICEAEAGDQGLIGMEAVALCLLNRTIKPDREFPSELRFVLYEQGDPKLYSYPQYSPVRDGALLRRLKGNFYNKTMAYKAADEAMKIFDDYVKYKKPRTLKGFDRKDFNFMYFMMEDVFWKQSLNFAKVDKFLYKDHMFFVDWVS